MKKKKYVALHQRKGKPKTNSSKKKKQKKGKCNRKPCLIFLPIFILFLLFCFLFQNKLKAENKDLTSSSVIPVIDVSKWEGTIHWNQVKSSGIRHAILKIGSGDHDGEGFHEDPIFETNYKNAVKNDIFCGVYFFSYAITTEEAKREALYCLDLLKKYDIKPSDLFFPVAFDIEYDKALQTGKRNCTDMTLTFCETIKEAGYEPMIYSSASYLENKLIYHEIKDYKLWVANYEASGPAFGKPYAMWQYSEHGHVDGIKDLCDMNYWYTNYIEVRELRTEEKSLTIQKGDTLTLNISIFPANATNKRLIFKSSNENVVKILDDQTGYIEAVNQGTAWITIRTPSGVKEHLRIIVE